MMMANELTQLLTDYLHLVGDEGLPEPLYTPVPLWCLALDLYHLLGADTPDQWHPALAALLNEPVDALERPAGQLKGQTGPSSDTPDRPRPGRDLAPRHATQGNPLAGQTRVE